MIGPLIQIIVMVALTHGFRALERRVGPRRSGLLMGLPSTTAITLITCGLERGMEEATIASEACLVGLVAATSLPITFAKAVGAGSRVSSAAGLAILVYVLIAAGLWWLPKGGPAASVLIAASGLAVACRLAGRISRVDGLETDAGGPPAGKWTLAGRTAVPVVYVALIRSLRTAMGSSWSSRFIIFPGGSLTLLVTTYLERGPGPAFRMAVSMPAGSLGTLAFLLAFRFGNQNLGLGWATALGYLAAILTLIAADFRGRRFPWPVRFGRSGVTAQFWSTYRVMLTFLETDASNAPAYPFIGQRMTNRRFSPGLEALVG